MKKLVFILLVLAVAITQEANAQKSFKVKMLDRRGRPLANAGIFIDHTSSDAVAIPNSNGIVSLNDVRESDTVRVMIGDRVYVIPAEGLDSVEVSVTSLRSRSNRSNVFFDFGSGSMAAESNTLNYGFGTVAASDNTRSMSSVNADVTESAYKDLTEYMKGRVAGLVVMGDDLRLSGGAPNSLNASQSVLVIVDGVETTFATANTFVNPVNIVKIDVLKDGSIYGSRGAGGVVLITTRSEGRR